MRSSQRVVKRSLSVSGRWKPCFCQQSGDSPPPEPPEDTGQGKFSEGLLTDVGRCQQMCLCTIAACKPAGRFSPSGSLVSEAASLLPACPPNSLPGVGPGKDRGAQSGLGGTGVGRGSALIVPGWAGRQPPRAWRTFLSPCPCYGLQRHPKPNCSRHGQRGRLPPFLAGRARPVGQKWLFPSAS